MAVMPDNRAPLCTLLEDHGVDPGSVVADSVRLPWKHAVYDEFMGWDQNGMAVSIGRRIELRGEPLMWYLACTQPNNERKR